MRLNISAYDDRQSGWGAQLALAACERGHRGHIIPLGTRPTQIPEGFFFARVEQFPPLHEQCKRWVLDLHREAHLQHIVTERDVSHYERKDLQAIDFNGRGMPDTFVCQSARDCRTALQQLGLPFVSKAAFGSGSSNVRLIESEEHAMLEATLAFGNGIPTTDRNARRGKQKGYVIWQRFLAGNEYVYRVASVGRWRWILKVHNRANSRFASGSGSYEPVTELRGDAQRAFFAADDFFRATGMRWGAVDMACDPITQEWQVLETTLAWNMRAPTANAACPIMSGRGTLHPRGLHGRDMWPLLLDEIEEGIFGLTAEQRGTPFLQPALRAVSGVDLLKTGD